MPTAERRAKQLAKALQAPRRQARRPRRHHRLEHATAISSSISPSPASARCCHTINPRLFADQLAYIVNHAEDKVMFLDLTFVPIAEKMAAAVGPGGALRRHDRSRAHAADGVARRAVLRGAASRREARARLARVRREHGVLALLHLGHDRQSQGRALYAIARPCCTASPICSANAVGDLDARFDPAGRADVPRQCLGRPLRRRRCPAPSSSSPARSSTAPACYELFETEKVTLLARRADGVARPAAISGADRQAPRRRQPRHRRRLGGAGDDDPDLRGEIRRPGASRAGA